MLAGVIYGLPKTGKLASFMDYWLTWTSFSINFTGIAIESAVWFVTIAIEFGPFAIQLVAFTLEFVVLTHKLSQQHWLL